LKFINLTRRTEIGANSYYLEIGRHRLVLDCGMHPKNTGEDALPNFKAIADQEIEAILISHAHQDHIGTLPVLMRRFPTARIFMTEATAEIGKVLLHNSVNVMTRQREEIGRAVAGLYPLFTHRETDRASERWRWCPLRQRISIAGERAPQREKDALTFEFFDAGHVLGSSGIVLRADGQTVFYTGDVNFDDQTIMEAAIFPDAKIDVLIMECTRGDHAKPNGWTRAGEERRLAEAIGAGFERRSCVLIPVFALGKTQEILAMLYKFRRERLLPEFPIYIGGLSSKMTDIYDRRAHMTRRQLPRLQLMREAAPFILNDQTVRDAPLRPGHVYVLSSGMMIPKTLSNILARRLIENPQHSIFLLAMPARNRLPVFCARRDRMARLLLIPTNRPSASAAISNNFSSARTRRARRSSITPKNFRPARLFLYTGIHQPWSGCAQPCRQRFPGQRSSCRRPAWNWNSEK